MPTATPTSAPALARPRGVRRVLLRERLQPVGVPDRAGGLRRGAHRPRARDLAADPHRRHPADLGRASWSRAASRASSGSGCAGCSGEKAATPRYVCARAERRASGVGAHAAARTPSPGSTSSGALVGLVTGTLAFAVAVVWWAGAAGGLTYWFWQRWIPRAATAPRASPTCSASATAGRPRAGSTSRSAPSLLLTLPLVVRLVDGAARQPGVRAAEQPRRAAARGRRVEGGRDAARVAEAESMRRLERDIHDGPQQRLVRLTMDLGRAKRQLAEDPDAGRPRRSTRRCARPARPSPSSGRCRRGHRAAAAGRPRPRRRARRRCSRTAWSRWSRPIDVPDAAAAARRDGRLLRGRRGAHQRRQAQRRHPRLGRRSWRRAARSRCASRTTASAARTRPRASASPVCGSGCAAVDGTARGQLAGVAGPTRRRAGSPWAA